MFLHDYRLVGEISTVETLALSYTYKGAVTNQIPGPKRRVKTAIWVM